MAHTYGAPTYRDVWGTRYVRIVPITIVDTYTTGGWAITAQDLGFGRTSSLVAVIPLNEATAASLSWEGGKLFARDWAGAQLGAASAVLAGAVVQVLAIATGQQG